MANTLQISGLIYVIFFVNIADMRCVNTSPETVLNSTQDDIITSFLNNAKHLLEVAKSYAVLKTSFAMLMPIDCAAILEANTATQSGIYRIWPRSRAIEGFIEVYCDMDDDGGAWTVIQRRGDYDSGDLYFYQNWFAYKSGFGDLNKDFWLGNDKIFAVTNQRLNTVKFVLSDFEGNTTYATYDDFWIEDESRNYTVHVNGYRGTAGDSFSYHDGFQFSTKDRDNINKCATSYFGAWWFGACHHSHLNGKYLNRTHQIGNSQGVYWHHFRGAYYSLKDTVIKIRPKHYKRKVRDVIPH